MHYSTMRPQAPVHDPKKDELRHAPWYWGNITREEAKNVLLGKPDGSFLVRDAQTKVSKKTKKKSKLQWKLPKMDSQNSSDKRSVRYLNSM